MKDLDETAERAPIKKKTELADVAKKLEEEADRDAATTTSGKEDTGKDDSSRDASLTRPSEEEAKEEKKPVKRTKKVEPEETEEA